MSGGAKAHHDVVRAFSETDQTGDLKAITVPVLILHGEDDQIVPIDNSARLAAKLPRNAVLKIYPGFSHGMLTVDAETVNSDLLAFFQA